MGFFQRNRFQILFSYRFLFGFRIVIPLMIGNEGARLLKPDTHANCLLFTFPFKHYKVLFTSLLNQSLNIIIYRKN